MTAFPGKRRCRFHLDILGLLGTAIHAYRLPIEFLASCRPPFFVTLGKFQCHSINPGAKGGKDRLYVYIVSPASEADESGLEDDGLPIFEIVGAAADVRPITNGAPPNRTRSGPERSTYQSRCAQIVVNHPAQAFHAIVCEHVIG
jgi:hypothetical protein